MYIYLFWRQISLRYWRKERGSYLYHIPRGNAIDLSQDTADLVSTAAQGESRLAFNLRTRETRKQLWLNDNSSISFFHEFIESKCSQPKTHWKRGFVKYSRLSRSINGILAKVYCNLKACLHGRFL